MTADIPNTFYWTTTYDHFNNVVTMNEFLNCFMPDEYTITFVDGTYSEIMSSEGIIYGVHASGDGDSYNHKIEFERV